MDVLDVVGVRAGDVGSEPAGEAFDGLVDTLSSGDEVYAAGFGDGKGGKDARSDEEMGGESSSGGGVGGRDSLREKMLCSIVIALFVMDRRTDAFVEIRYRRGWNTIGVMRAGSIREKTTTGGLEDCRAQTAAR